MQNTAKDLSISERRLRSDCKQRKGGIFKNPTPLLLGNSYSHSMFMEDWERSNPHKMAGKIKATTLTGFQVNISTPPEKQWDFPHKALKEQENAEW